MDRIQYPYKNDHEVVIALIEDFNNTVVQFGKQMTDNNIEVLEVKKILQTQGEQLDYRLSQIEESWRQLDPKVLAEIDRRFIEQVQKSARWIETFDSTKHMAYVILSSLFLIIGYLLSHFNLLKF